MAVAITLGAGWLGSLLTFRPTRGKDWRGYEGIVRLQPTVVYRFTLEAPFDTTPALDMTATDNQAALERALEETGARNISFRVGDRGVVVEFDQSFGDPRQLDFSSKAIGPFHPVLARRLDGLDWEAP